MTLARLEAANQLKGWSVYSGSVYSISFTEPKIVSINQDGVDLAESNSSSLSAGEWYFDLKAQVIYLRCSDNSDPDTKFIGCIFELFFSSHPVRAPHDLDSGYSVEWKPLIQSTSSFGVGLDNKQANLGAAIEGAGSIRFLNSFSYWSSRFDKYAFQNRRCKVYLYARNLPINEAKIVYKGLITDKSYSIESVSFNLKDLFNALRAPVSTTNLEDLGGARIRASNGLAKARRIYGYVFGHVCPSIDEIDQSYPLDGTVTVTAASTAISGSSSSFLSQLKPGDEIRISDDINTVTIDTITSNIAATLTEEYEGSNSGSGKSYTLYRSRRGKSYANRIFKVAHHVLARPQAALGIVYNDRTFQIDDTTNFIEGDPVEINSQFRTIAKLNGDIVKLNQSITSTPSTSDIIYRSSISNVYINDRKLLESRDYTYSAPNAEITLTSTAELEVAPTLPLESGTLTITASNRVVSGTGTSFKSELTPGDYIRIVGNPNWLEVLSIEEEDSLTLVTSPTSNDEGTTDSGEIRKPEIYNDRGFTLTCDSLGKTSDGTTSGTFLKYPNQILEDLLGDAGLSDDIDSSQFSSTPIEGRHRLGVVSPMKWNQKKEETVREVIKRVNRSCFTSIFQTDSFEIGYYVLRPALNTSALTEIDEHDILSIQINSDNESVIKTAKVRYKRYEIEPVSGEESFSEQTSTSLRSDYLASTEREIIEESLVVDQTSASIFAGRWRFLLEFPISTVTISTKLQTSQLSINSLVRISHPKLYERFGSTEAVRVGLISNITKSQSGVVLTINDLGNAFARCARIAQTGTAEWNSASMTEKQNYGFITSTDGMIENDSTTFGINTIW